MRKTNFYTGRRNGKKKEIEEIIRNYNRERDAAVASLNVETFKTWCRKWGNPYPGDDWIIEITMRKMMYHITSFSEEDRQSAKEWLESRGFSVDLGDSE